MTAEIPDEILRYFAARDRERAEQVDQALAALTDRERALVREAAVMAYVRGVMAAGGTSRDVQIPPDMAVVREVVAACQVMPDLYPNLGKDPQ